MLTDKRARPLKPIGAPRSAVNIEEDVPHSSSLPDKPLVIIAPTKSWVALGLYDLWSYRELFYFLMWRDIKVRYKQTLLGASWAIIQPVFTMLIFTLFFGQLAGIPSDGIPYPIFAYAALMPWTFFSNAVTNSGNSLIGSSHLITKIYFPRLLIPSAAVGAGLVDLAMAFLVLVVLMAYYQIGITWNLVMLPALIILTTLLALSVGLLMSALNVKYRDVRHTLPFILQLWMFVSPIIYPPSFVPGKYRSILKLNPLTGIIEGFRASLFGRHAFDWTALAISTLITFALLVYAAYTFRRMEKHFADIV